MVHLENITADNLVKLHNSISSVYPSFTLHMTKMKFDISKKNTYSLGIYDGRNLVGGMTVENNLDSSFSLDYFIAKPFQKKGYASLAVEKVIEGVQSLNAELLIASVDYKNNYSQKVLENNGFRKVDDFLGTLFIYEKELY